VGGKSFINWEEKREKSTREGKRGGCSRTKVKKKGEKEQTGRRANSEFFPFKEGKRRPLPE